MSDTTLRKRTDDGADEDDAEIQNLFSKDEPQRTDEPQQHQQQPPAPSSSTISGQSLFFFTILVGQSVGTQTFFKLSQKGGTYDYNTMSAMAVVEGIKLAISFSQLIVDQDGNLSKCKGVFQNVDKRVYFAYVFLAFSYAGYNQLIFHVMKLADPGTFALFKSLMPAAVGFLNLVTFGKTLTQSQVLCIMIQICGIVPVATSTNETGKVDFTYGTQAVIVMTCTVLFAAFNTVYNASVVKKESANYPMNVQNSILYSAGFAVNLFSYCVSKRPGDKNFFYGYNNLSVVVLLFLNSTVGITISMVYKYGDAVLKTLSQPLVSSILVFLSNILFDVPLDIIKLSGAGTVIISTMLYLKLPPPAPDSNLGGPSIFKKGGLKLRAALFALMGVGIIAIMRVIMSMPGGKVEAEEFSNLNQTAQSMGG